MDFAPVDEEPEAEQQRDNEDDDEEAPPTGNETTLLFDRHRGRRSWGAQLRLLGRRGREYNGKIMMN